MMTERFRITFQKTDALRYVSHLDLQKIWIRTLLRANIPLAYTQGFHPSPKIAPGWPLALGWAGYGEMIDLWFENSDSEKFKSFESENEIIQLINKNSPPGLKSISAKSIPLFDPALTTIIQSAVYQMIFLQDLSLENLKEKMDSLMMLPSIDRNRRNKSYDLKPLIESYDIFINKDQKNVMEIQMAARDSAMGRPDEVADQLGFDIYQILFARIKMLLQYP
ncbi:MAG: TIGR03936 family radical SAM-associated protein [Flexilinea sp.]